MTERKCKNCEWWVRNRESPMVSSDYGSCRIRSPWPVDNGGADGFPQTHFDSWCGEFRARANAEQEGAK